MLSTIVRHLYIIGLGVGFLTTLYGQALASEPTVTFSHIESNKVASTTHTDPSSRVDALVDHARDEKWATDDLFIYLELDDADGCLDFSDRTRLRERHARWSEAVNLLDLIDPDALDRWLLGLDSPPAIAEEETNRQLRCLVEGLIDAIHQSSYDIRLFPNISERFGGRFDASADLARAVDTHPSWLDRTLNAITRSTFRNLGSQAHIWHRKFVFSGRAFNRISAEAAEKCNLHGEQIWRPDSDRHRRCWHQKLSTEQREQEILSASAGPGLSRHHWGTDVDILGLNPVLFRQGAVLHDDWRWLDDHGLDYGFFQTYQDLDFDGQAHMEEPWHWSYYPIAQALWDFAKHNPDRVEKALFEQWDRLERAWGHGGGPYFDHLREHWHDYFFHIHIPSIDAESPPSTRETGPYAPLP